ncbi:ribosome biogenesis GTPase YlqF [Texas Phoenix palm phytoplasma]|uniref:Ribosome biogenesis GTPase A n=1 Tax=Texas Phoenix palm phytoplasma TaxID=176709 RepID=A0ABS5BL62_9MOLU|nr:ribosome biogenesis GTPase YlqF [Texas Phoenix palm phytoplasma]MBP3059517.1 ribosome biogenesis GTPase YlqF [Texas Phoenix palm phytoplasma]
MNTKNNINWFPGHMKKTLEEIKNNLKLVDMVLIILDARIPFSSMNFELLKCLNNKPVLVLLNKMSLADSSKINIFIDFFKKENLFTLKIDAKERNNINLIIPKIKQIIKNYPFKKKRTNNLLKIMITGVPNVGKSTLINCLTKKKSTQTADKPGITKKLQWINLKDKIKLLDTPGVLYYKNLNLENSYSLCICGCIKDKIIPKEFLLNYFFPYLKKYYYENLKNCFKLSNEELNEEDLLSLIMKKNYNYQNNISNKNQLFSVIIKKIKSGKLKKVNFDLNICKKMIK